MREAALLDRLVPARSGAAGRSLSLLLRDAGLMPGGTLQGDPVVTGVEHDSRACKPGDVFVAVRGIRDGADFAAAAIGLGARAVVAASPDRGLGVPWIEVADDRAALADLACALHGRPSHKLLVLGITGTNGKTTTTHLTAAVLGAAGGSVGLMSTVESRRPGHAEPSSRTTAEATEIQRQLADMADEGCAACVLEVSSHGIDLQRVAGTRFSAVAFTNLSQDHLDWYGDLESYYRSKRRLFLELGCDAPAVACVDDEWGARLAREIEEAAPARRLVRVGFAPGADLRIEGFEGRADGSSFRLRGEASETGLPRGVDLAIELALPGRHNAANAAVAAALALVLEAPDRLVTAGLASVEGVAGRLEPVPCEGGPSVFVDYAHTPAALEGVLAAARGFTRGRLVCVFGCGGDKDKDKRPLMGEAVGRLADVAVATSDNPRSEDPHAILDQAVAGLRRGRAEIHVESDRRKAIALALELAGPGDVIVVAGKGHETFQDAGGRKTPFDDRQVARELIAARRCR